MNLNERAECIIDELIAIQREMWEREEHGGQVYFTAKGHSGLRADISFMSRKGWQQNVRYLTRSWQTGHSDLRF